MPLLGTTGPHHAPVLRLEPGATPEPEGARGGQRQQVGEEVAGLVHDVDAQLGVRDADVDVHPEDEQLADDVLHLVLEELVPLGLGDALVLPMRERVRAGRGQPKAVTGQQASRDRPGAGAAQNGASLTSEQIFVPISTTDCIISAFTSSPNRGSAEASNVSMWAFSSPSASMIWNSSSLRS